MESREPGALRFLGSETAGYADVYDLQVEGEHEFYANGILAHNCSRYGIKSKLNPNTTIPREVRVREVLESAGEDPNVRAMSMRVFEANEAKGQRLVTRPRWRV